MTKKEAQSLVDAFDVEQTLCSLEEVELLQEQNPLHLRALRALYKIATGRTVP
jgi:hypothetical protein